MAHKLFWTLVLALLLAGFGCKKDSDDSESTNEPATEEQSGEKVEKPTDSKKKAARETSGKKPSPRKLVEARRRGAKERRRLKPRTSATKPPVPPGRRPARVRPALDTEGGDAESSRAAPLKRRNERPARRAGGDERRPKAERSAASRRTGPSGRSGLGPTRKPSYKSGLPRPNAELLLQKKDIQEILKIRSRLDVHNIEGQKTGPGYDGVYWGSPDGKRFVAGVQIWQPGDAKLAKARYSQMLSNYPNATETKAITNKTILAHWNDFTYLAFWIPNKQTVVSVTCHRKLCNTPDRLVKLADKVHSRL
jgi:hypothetical protein